MNETLANGYNIVPMTKTSEPPCAPVAHWNLLENGRLFMPYIGLPRAPITSKSPQTKLQKDLAKVFLDLREVVSVLGKIFAGLVIAAMAVAVAVACVTKNGNRRRRLRHPWTC